MLIFRNTPRTSKAAGRGGKPPCTNPRYLAESLNTDGPVVLWAFRAASSVTIAPEAVEPGREKVAGVKCVGVALRTPCPACGAGPGACNHDPSYFTFFLGLGDAAALCWDVIRAYLYGCWDAGVGVARPARAYSILEALARQEIDRLRGQCRLLRRRLREAMASLWLLPRESGHASRVVAADVGIHVPGKAAARPRGKLSSCVVLFETMTRDQREAGFWLRLTWGNAKWLAEQLRTAVERRRGEAEAN